MFETVIIDHRGNEIERISFTPEKKKVKRKINYSTVLQASALIINLFNLAFILTMTH